MTVCADSGKTAYPSRRSAIRAARTIASASGGGRRMRAYQCPGHSHWHLTSSQGDKLSRRLAQIGRRTARNGNETRR
jgi:hypothetical protein